MKKFTLYADCINGVTIDVKSINLNNPILHRIGKSAYYPLYDCCFNHDAKDQDYTRAATTLLAIPSCKTIKAHSKMIKTGIYEFDIYSAKEDMAVDHENFFTNVIKFGK